MKPDATDGVADLRAENDALRVERAKLRAELADMAKHRIPPAWYDKAVTCVQAERDRDAARAELAALRAQVEAAAPSDAEIEAWWKINAYAMDKPRMLIADEAKAMMRRAQRVAPAPSALVDAAQWLVNEASQVCGTSDAHGAATNRWEKALRGPIAATRAALAASPSPEPPANVAVPHDIREKAARQVEAYDTRMCGPMTREAVDCCKWILSLPAAQPAPPHWLANREVRR